MTPNLDTILENFEDLDVESQLFYALQFEEFMAEDDDPIFSPEGLPEGPSETLIHKLF